MPPGRMERRTSSAEIIDLLIHLVGRLDYFRIRFVAALRLNQIDEFVNNGDVGLFDVALQQRAESLGTAWHADRRIARRVRGRIQIVANGIQSGWVLEVRELNLPRLL